MKLLLRLLVIAASLQLSLSVALVSQTVIDATVPIRDRLRKPTEGHGGGIGRKLPIQIAVEFQPSQPDAEGRMRVTFIVTNTSEKELVIPVWPHPGDLEPSDKDTPYVVKFLHLYISSNRERGSALPGGAQLYGNAARPETLLTLLPGKSVRVIARVDVSTVLSSDQGSSMLLVGHVVMSDEKVSTFHDQTFVDSQEVGSADSPEYKAESLLKPSK